MRKRSAKGTPDPIDRYVGTRVRARRVGLRMSQTKLGQAIGVTFQQIQKYENGTNRIGASNLFKIAKTLDTEVAFFYEHMPESLWMDEVPQSKGLADQSMAEFEHDPMHTREAIELSHNYFRIPSDTVRRRIFQLVKTIAESMKRR